MGRQVHNNYRNSGNTTKEFSNIIGKSTPLTKTPWTKHAVNYPLTVQIKVNVL